jgi:hypothetical protein
VCSARSHFFRLTPSPTFFLARILSAQSASTQLLHNTRSTSYALRILSLTPFQKFALIHLREERLKDLCVNTRTIIRTTSYCASSPFQSISRHRWSSKKVSERTFSNSLIKFSAINNKDSPCFNLVFTRNSIVLSRL